MSKKNSSYFINASKSIEKWYFDLEKKGFKPCVIVMPYEMQVSKNASKYYKSIGIKFDKGFENFLTQKIIKNNLNNKVNFFILNNFPEAEVGKYFVHNKGDKIDFNHPNRLGHLIIAQEIFKNNFCQN